MSNPLNTVLQKGDMPGITQVDVINQSHPGYFSPIGQRNLGQEKAVAMGMTPEMEEMIMNMAMGSSPMAIGSMTKGLNTMTTGAKNIKGALGNFLSKISSKLTNRPGSQDLSGAYAAREKALKGLTSKINPQHWSEPQTLKQLLDLKSFGGPGFGGPGHVTGSIGARRHPFDMGSRGIDILHEAYTKGRFIPGRAGKTVAPGKGAAPAKNVMPPGKGVGETIIDFIKRDVSKTLGKKNLERLNKSVQYELGDIQRGWLHGSTHEIQMLVNKYGTKLKPGTKGYLEIEEALYKKHANILYDAR